MELETHHKVSSDSFGNPLDGSKKYRMHLPPDIPASKFWSILVYDNKTRLIIRTDQTWPSVHSNIKNLIFNPDGSLDAYFGPEAPPGKESNWVKTIPGEEWNLVIRLYFPQESWFNHSWIPGAIEQLVQ